MPDQSLSTPPGRRPLLRPALDAIPAYTPGRRATTALTAALASNESHLAPLPSVQDAVREAASRVNRYPDASAVRLRAAIGDALHVDPDTISVGPGSVGVLQQLLAAFCDAGDEVVFAWRSFEAYPILVGLAGARAVTVPLTGDGAHDLDAMAAAVTERTRIVLLCVPNNPTGVGMPHTDLERFLDRVPPTVLVVVDEAYAEFVDDPDAVDALRLLDDHPNLCVLRTFSKAYGLAGLRIGYCAASAYTADGLRRAALPFGVGTAAQEAAIASLAARGELRARVAEVRAERERVTTAARTQGRPVPVSQANFFWVPARGRRLAALLTAFGAADVLVRPFADEGIRVTLADRAANDRVLDVLANAGVGVEQ
ncbi:histidinol-phosphate transaminase [Streptomyces sp. NPDC003247]|uniref:histidinol-phosphate transaminase n=1 Tax=Streptomyces sp. NPDC003247 TaxID=3364677 RepID=UPI00368E76FB